VTEILALYRGQTVGEARLVAVTVDPEIVGRFAEELVGEAGAPETDPASYAEPEELKVVEGGRE
jgi:hypothetical protein